MYSSFRSPGSEAISNRELANIKHAAAHYDKNNEQWCLFLHELMRHLLVIEISALENDGVEVFRLDPTTPFASFFIMSFLFVSCGSVLLYGVPRISHTIY